MDNHFLKEMALRTHPVLAVLSIQNDCKHGCLWIAQMSQIHLKEPEGEAMMFRGGPANLYLSIKEPLFSTFSVQLYTVSVFTISDQ